HLRAGARPDVRSARPLRNDHARRQLRPGGRGSRRPYSHPDRRPVPRFVRGRAVRALARHQMLAIVTTNLLRPKPPTITPAGGIAGGVAPIVALLSFTQGLRDTAAGFVHLGGSDLGVFQANVSEPTASILPASMVGRLAARPEVARATPLLLLVESVRSEP